MLLISLIIYAVLVILLCEKQTEIDKLKRLQENLEFDLELQYRKIHEQDETIESLYQR